MRKTRLLVMHTAIFMLVCGILCGIFFIAANREIYLTPKREIHENAHAWVHAGDHFMWTIEE